MPIQLIFTYKFRVVGKNFPDDHFIKYGVIHQNIEVHSIIFMRQNVFLGIQLVGPSKVYIPYKISK